MIERVLIGDALTEASAFLRGVSLREEDKALVDAAFARFGRQRPSDDVGECARALLALMSE